MYKGKCGSTSGVGIIVSSKFEDNISEVQRYDDHVMKTVNTQMAEKSTFSVPTLHKLTKQLPSRTPFGGRLMQRLLKKDEQSTHGRHGFGEKNDDVQHILNFSEAHNLAIANTWFKKRDSHLITYYSRTNAMQIDYILVRRRDLKDVLDTKVIPYETVATQHRPLIFEESWEKGKESAHEAAHTSLGTTQPGQQESIEIHGFGMTLSKTWYTQRNHYTLRERDLHRLAKARLHNSEYVHRFYGVSDGTGNLLVHWKKSRERWCSYFKKISTEEFPHPPIPTGNAAEGPTGMVMLCCQLFDACPSSVGGLRLNLQKTEAIVALLRMLSVYALSLCKPLT
ncbi:uncharacterized protein LOC126335835 [Schistocerca gregaria]|uniref:uncharacterized protein LOC126335835 n=1 Tax=Schistocerca gregaria TaxID=7010 RepID=UPI00211DE3E9|nr:uncharacterized protein LOC126335835 [Schistocerca gregaria]